MSQSLLFDSETIKSISSPSCSPGLVSSLLDRPTIQSSVVVAAVGLGKTAIMASLAQRWPTGRVMMISHRFELNQQAIKEFEFVCREPVDLEQAMYRADQRGTPHRIVVASVQSLVSVKKGKKRFEKFNPNDFGLLMIDECFPLGTIIDGKPIEAIREGDIVTAYDAVTKRTIKRKVVRLFKKRAPAKMVRITTGSRSIVATCNHPFLTQRGFVNAEEITNADTLFGMWEKPRSQTMGTETAVSGRIASVVQSNLPRECSTEGDNCELSSVRNRLQRRKVARQDQSKQGIAGLLLDDMHEISSGRNLSKIACIQQQEVCVSANEGAEPDEIRVDSKKSLRNNETPRMQACNTRRKRAWVDGAGINAVRSNEVESTRICDWHGENEGIPDSLQDGLSRTNREIVNRDRWRKSQFIEDKSCGSTEGSILESARVDSVEILECGSDRERDELCPDGFVYNFEVEGEHTYIANGFAVHNCHRATSPTYRQVIAHFQQNPNLKMVLVTATPDRSDKVGLACVADNVACNYDILWGVQNGWLCPPKQKFYHLHELKLDEVRTVGGDLDPRQLAHQLEQEKNLHGIAVAMVDECGKDDQSIVFCASVPQAERVAQLLRDYHERKFGASDRTIAISLSGKLSPQDPIRRNLIKQFRDGEIQHFVNMQIATEGFNAPNVKVIGMGRPTKSRALYQQSIGRGSRTLPGVVDGFDTPEDRLAAIKASDKPHFTVIDFIGQASRHELSCTFDFMAGEEPPDICDAAKRIAKRPDFNGNTLDAIKQAKAEKEAALELARHRVTAGVSYSLTEEEIYPNTFSQAPCPSFLRTVAPSDKQKNMLLKLGYTGPQVAQMNPRSASRAIDHAIKHPKTSFGKWLAKKTRSGT